MIPVSFVKKPTSITRGAFFNSTSLFLTCKIDLKIVSKMKLPFSVTYGKYELQ
jgi:hypothetical protein